MPKFKIRYLVIRRMKGHDLYYWRPKKKYMVEGGFMVQRLAESTNRLEDAIIEAGKYNAELDAWRRGEQQGGLSEGTVAWVSNQYQKDDLFTNLAVVTQKEYTRYLKIIENTLGNIPVQNISRKTAKLLYSAYKDKSRTAQLLAAVARILFNFAEKDLELIDKNPFAKMRIKTSKPRTQIWEAIDMQKVADQAIAIKRPSVALALYMGAYTGQRQGDILKCNWNQYNGKKIKVKQSKTGALVDVPVTKALKAMLDSAPRTSTQIITSEETGRPYKSYDFRHLFREVAKLTDIKQDLQYRDLRRTAVLRLGEAGCTIGEIAAVTGHSIEECQKIMDTYLQPNSKMAENAIKKFERKK